MTSQADLLCGLGMGAVECPLVGSWGDAIMAQNQEIGAGSSEPHFFRTLLVYADYENSYLWNMNSVSITSEDITGNKGHALDLKFEKWAGKYDAYIPEIRPFENLPKEREQFNHEGLALARELFEFLKKRHTIIYYPLTAKKVTFAAEMPLAA